MVELAIGPLRVRNGQTLIAQSRTRRLRSLSLLEPHSGAAAILGDELDAGDRKSSRITARVELFGAVRSVSNAEMVFR